MAEERPCWGSNLGMLGVTQQMGQTTKWKRSACNAKVQPHYDYDYNDDVLEQFDSGMLVAAGPF